MIFAAKEAVEKKALERGRQAGRQEGQQEGRRAERERIERALEALKETGVQVPPEISRIIARESSQQS